MIQKLKQVESQGRGFPLAKYRQAKGWDGKRGFARKFSLGPACGWLEAEETEWLKNNEQHKLAEGWCYVWDVARIEGVPFRPGDAQQERWLMNMVVGCEDRESPDPVRRAAGDKQWWYQKAFETLHTRDKGKRVHTRKVQHTTHTYINSKGVM